MKKRWTALLMAALVLTSLPAGAAVVTEEADVARGKHISVIAGATGVGDLSYLVDGDPDTYWESVTTGYNSICIDLGKEYRIKRIRVNIPEEISEDSAAYFTLGLSTTGTGGNFEEVLMNEQIPASGEYTHNVTLETPYRYVKIQNVMGNSYGFSDIEIYADEEKLELKDVAQGQPITINMGATLNGQPADVLDGDPDTYWMSQGTFTVLEIDLGKPRDIMNITVTIPEAVKELTEGSYGVGLSNTKGGQDVEWYDDWRLNPSAGQSVHAVATDTAYRYVKFYTYSGLPYGFSDVKVYTKDPYYRNWCARKGDEVVTDLKDGVDSVEVEIVDNRDAAQPATLLAVLYNSSDRMVACRAVSTPGERGNSTLSVDISDWEIPEGATLRAVLVDNLTNMHMLDRLFAVGYGE